jgi:hypothetical protein
MEIKQSIPIEQQKTIHTADFETTILKTKFGCIIVQKNPFDRVFETWLTKCEIAYINKLTMLDIDLNVIA